jgi:hypothetical protein
MKLPAVSSSPFIALLAAMALLSCARAQGAVRISVTNPLDVPRPAETVAIGWQALRQTGPDLRPEMIVVREQASDRAVVSQVIDSESGTQPKELIFQTDFGPGETKVFTVQSGRPPAAEPRAFGRLVPERKDDFAWENDRIAFRIYGKRLEDELVSSGVDVWCKRTRALIVDSWYRRDDYHVDHGEGLDCYKVGEGRGCGGTAVFKDGKLYSSRNFVKSRTLASGPVRVAFELTYEDWDGGGLGVAETKRISLDAGQNLNRFECTFTARAGAGGLPIAIGLGEHPGAEALLRPKEGWMRVWEPTDTNSVGNDGIGLVIGPGRGFEMKETVGHALAVVSAKSGDPVVFYAGAGWDKSGDFPSSHTWDEYLAHFAKCIRSPLKISVSSK